MTQELYLPGHARVKLCKKHLRRFAHGTNCFGRQRSDAIGMSTSLGPAESLGLHRDAIAAPLADRACRRQHREPGKYTAKGRRIYTAGMDRQRWLRCRVRPCSAAFSEWCREV